MSRRFLSVDEETRHVQMRFLLTDQTNSKFSTIQRVFVSPIPLFFILKSCSDEYISYEDHLICCSLVIIAHNGEPPGEL